MKTITVTIPLGGKPNIKTEGFTGGACLNAAKPISDALRDTRKERDVEMTDESYLTNTETSQDQLYDFN